MGLHERHRLLPKFSPEVRAELEDLLQYPDHTAGGIMTTEFVRLDPAVLSAPWITTLVDATGLIIYFTIAKLILGV